MNGISNLLQQFARFFVTAGIAWLADLLVFFVITHFNWLTPGLANIVSCLVGASFAWLLSMRHVFYKQQAGSQRMLLVYWAYVLATILLFSALINAMVPELTRLGTQVNLVFSAPLWAKILVTPPSLLLNFFVMRALASKLRDLEIAKTPTA
jgi:putative flippase GtrA